MKDYAHETPFPKQTFLSVCKNKNVFNQRTLQHAWEVEGQASLLDVEVADDADGVAVGLVGGQVGVGALGQAPQPVPARSGLNILLAKAEHPEVVGQHRLCAGGGLGL